VTGHVVYSSERFTENTSSQSDSYDKQNKTKQNKKNPVRFPRAPYDTRRFQWFIAARVRVVYVGDTRGLIGK